MKKRKKIYARYEIISVKKDKKRKVAIVAAIIALVIMAVGMYITNRNGIYLDKDFFFKKNSNRYQKDSCNYIERISNEEIMVVIDGYGKRIQYQMDGTKISFAFPDGEQMEGEWDGENIIVSKRQAHAFVTERQGVECSNIELATTLCEMLYKKDTTRFVWYLNIVGLPVYALGIAIVFFPQEVYHRTRKYKERKCILSNLQMIEFQIIGCVAVISGIGIMTGLIFLYG